MVGFFVVLELLSNNVIEPLVLGNRIGLSPFAMILSAIFWAWLWGPIGIVLAAPITACLVAFGRHAPSLEPLAILLSDADALPPAERLYQRLLARDSYEATALIAERTEALGALERLGRGRAAGARRPRARSTGAASRPRADRRRPRDARAGAERAAGARPRRTAAPVLCIPARGGWDETVCAALARFLSAVGVPARAIGHKLSAELAAEVAQAGAEFVCISCLASPAGAARHLVTRIRKSVPGDEGRRRPVGPGRATRRSTSASEPTPRTYVTSRLVEARDRVRASTPN